MPLKTTDPKLQKMGKRMAKEGITPGIGDLLSNFLEEIGLSGDTELSFPSAMRRVFKATGGSNLGANMIPATSREIGNSLPMDVPSGIGSVWIPKMHWYGRQLPPLADSAFNPIRGTPQTKEATDLVRSVNKPPIPPELLRNFQEHGYPPSMVSINTSNIAKEFQPILDDFISRLWQYAEKFEPEAIQNVRRVDVIPHGAIEKGQAFSPRSGKPTPYATMRPSGGQPKPDVPGPDKIVDVEANWDAWANQLGQQRLFKQAYRNRLLGQLAGFLGHEQRHAKQNFEGWVKPWMDEMPYWAPEDDAGVQKLFKDFEAKDPAGFKEWREGKWSTTLRRPHEEDASRHEELIRSTFRDMRANSPGAALIEELSKPYSDLQELAQSMSYDDWWDPGIRNLMVTNPMNPKVPGWWPAPPKPKKQK